MVDWVSAIRERTAGGVVGRVNAYGTDESIRLGRAPMLQHLKHLGNGHGGERNL